MKCLENSIKLRELGYILHDYIYRPIKLFQFKIQWKRSGPWCLYGNALPKPRVLYVSLINGGGLKKHLNDLTKGMTATHDVWILYDDNILWHWVNNKWNVYRYPDDMHLWEVVGYINPDIIHIHQLSRSLDEMNTILTSKSKVVITVHDLYYVCPHFFMTECLGTKFCHPSSCSDEWRSKMLRLLHKCHTIVCPSQGIQDILTFYYPDIKDKCIIIEHGIKRTFHE